MNDLAATLANKTVLTVSQLNNAVKNQIESEFRQVWVEGEISNFSAPGSGHWYFTLKDSRAQIRCAMFRNRNQKLRFRPKQGDQFIARGQLSLYAARGDYQLIVENLTDAGAGALQRAFEALKENLSEKGWFDQGIKRPLPSFPQHIVVITSATGAVWHDIQTVFKRRFPMIKLTLAPVNVQGSAAVDNICQAFNTLETLHRNDAIDAIILARGGGSLEDLSAFNDLAVATVIHDSSIPVVSGIGHETDVSIADFVADKRAATPTAAAELLSPDQQVFTRRISDAHNNLIGTMQSLLTRNNLALEQIQSRIKHPQTRILEQNQHLDDLTSRLQQLIKQKFTSTQTYASQLGRQLTLSSPIRKIKSHSLVHQHLHQSLLTNTAQLLEKRNNNFRHLATQLHCVSPLATLDRGYAIVQGTQEGVLSSATAVKSGDAINIRFSDGQVNAHID